MNNTKVVNAKDLDVVMPMHNLIEYFFSLVALFRVGFLSFAYLAAANLLRIGISVCF